MYVKRRSRTSETAMIMSAATMIVPISGRAKWWE